MYQNNGHFARRTSGPLRFERVATMGGEVFPYTVFADRSYVCSASGGALVVEDGKVTRRRFAKPGFTQTVHATGGPQPHKLGDRLLTFHRGGLCCRALDDGRVLWERADRNGEDYWPLGKRWERKHRMRQYSDYGEGCIWTAPDESEVITLSTYGAARRLATDDGRVLEVQHLFGVGPQQIADDLLVISSAAYRLGCGVATGPGLPEGLFTGRGQIVYNSEHVLLRLPDWEVLHHGPDLDEVPLFPNQQIVFDDHLLYRGRDETRHLRRLDLADFRSTTVSPEPLDKSSWVSIASDGVETVVVGCQIAHLVANDGSRQEVLHALPERPLYGVSFGTVALCDAYILIVTNDAEVLVFDRQTRDRIACDELSATVREWSGGHIFGAFCDGGGLVLAAGKKVGWIG